MEALCNLLSRLVTHGRVRLNLRPKVEDSASNMVVDAVNVLLSILAYLKLQLGYLDPCML